ncbi:MAG: molybdopterin guanine dinucleotide-containing S/N-oxide reductase [Armatimonadetes bacterium]|nr:molybdopterin guanine dinucleotide-containing S/N-oxide reductase [Armatimonadota bacterium]
MTTIHSHLLHTSHWGAFRAETVGDTVVAIRPYEGDPDPSPILENIATSLDHRARIAEPMVRAGWLDRGPGPDSKRGAEPFVPVSWDVAIDLLSRELKRVYETHGGEAVYGGSYGWASAGRFHHAQSQLHRFLNVLGGCVRSTENYSNAALMRIMPHVVGSIRAYMDRATSWTVLERHTDLFVCFGGIPLKNTQVTPGGSTTHPTRDHLMAAKRRGAEFVLIGPLRDDLPAFTEPRWLAPRPGTDVALMLGLAHTLTDEGLHDRDFLGRCCAGYDRFEGYLLGRSDGIAKSAAWAEEICGIPADAIRALARRMAQRRTFINVNWSLQRVQYGEQAPWMVVTLAAMLGQIGSPGGGFGHGYGSLGYVGRPHLKIGPPALGQEVNPVKTTIPVARVSDMLLHPGETYDFDGKRFPYPDIKLVYWCGGNPFHHHQDLARLRRAFARPETIVVHEPHWTPMAKHADVVLPATVTLERNDISGSTHDLALVAMRRVVAPHGEARNDYDVFADVAARLGAGEQFTENRTEMEWIRHLYESWREKNVGRDGWVPPQFDEFWGKGIVEIPAAQTHTEVVLYEDFRADPARAPLNTPSGRIEIFSETIDGFGYDDCPGHPTWLEPTEWLGAPLADRYPLHLIANNPKTRLHSQLDMGAYSQASKVAGREPIRLHPDDAARRGIVNGDTVRVFNDRGSCLAGAIITDGIRPGAAQLSTGAWYDPINPEDPNAMCVHGNPNVLTYDRGTSRLGQGCSGQHALVEVEKWTRPLPPLKAFNPPPVERRG